MNRPQRRRRLAKGCSLLALVLLVLLSAAVVFVFVQGRRTPAGTPTYVALGSSYAAGAGLGGLQVGSPLLCARTVAGYPQQLSRALQLPTVDMSCGGATTDHVLHGGRFFQGAQIRVIHGRTRLVTLTIGGNDVGLVGDLSMLAMRRDGGVGGWLVRQSWNGPRPVQQRGFADLRRELTLLVAAIRSRAPQSRIVIATYPAILPPSGTCPQLHLSAEEVDRMRPVEAALADTTRAVAAENGVLLVDMHALGAAHHACSQEPWTHGWSALSAAPFHPTLAGAVATADAIRQALGSTPRGTARSARTMLPPHR